MNDLYLTLGPFGTSAKYSAAFGEVTLPGIIKRLDEQHVIIEDEIFGQEFSIDFHELVMDSPKIGQQIDFVVLTEPEAQVPGIGSERRACRIGINVTSHVARVVSVQDRTVVVDVNGVQCSVEVSPIKGPLAVGDGLPVEQHTSGAIWLS